MPTYKAPVESVLFLLQDVLGYERYANLPGFADAPLDTVEAVLGEAARFCEEVLQPLNRVGDREGCTRHDDGTVTTPAGFKEAYRSYSRGRLGRPLRRSATMAARACPMRSRRSLNEFVTSANMALGMYPGLTQGAIAALDAARLGGAEGALPAEARVRRMVGHDEPDRAALRHRPRPDQDEGRRRPATAATASPARRSSSPPASTI